MMRWLRWMVTLSVCEMGSMTKRVTMTETWTLSWRVMASLTVMPQQTVIRTAFWKGTHLQKVKWMVLCLPTR